MGARLRCCFVVFAVLGCFGTPSDRDDDGIPDLRDNCPSRANADQHDTVGDGIGDACRCDAVRCDTVSTVCSLAPTCVATTGLCVAAHRAEGTACNDGNLCTENDACRAGVCTGSARACPGGSACVLSACDPAVGCVTTYAIAGTPCDDSIPGTDGETCDGRGTCSGGCAATLARCGSVIVRGLRSRRGGS